MKLAETSEQTLGDVPGELNTWARAEWDCWTEESSGEENQLLKYLRSWCFRNNIYEQEGHYLEVVTHGHARTHMQMHTFCLTIWRFSCRHDAISPSILQLVSPKDILLYNHSAVITPKKCNIDTIWSEIQSISKFPQLSQTAFDRIFWICDPSQIMDCIWLSCLLRVFYRTREHSNTLQKLGTSHNTCFTAISTCL